MGSAECEYFICCPSTCRAYGADMTLLVPLVFRPRAALLCASNATAKLALHVPPTGAAALLPAVKPPLAALALRFCCCCGVPEALDVNGRAESAVWDVPSAVMGRWVRW